MIDNANDCRKAHELPKELDRPLLDLLFGTYPVYVDRDSRRDAQRCIREIFKAPISSVDLKDFANKLQKECSNPSIAAANAFVLLEWCCLFLQHLSQRGVDKLEDATQLAVSALSANSKALETCLRSSKKDGLKHSAIIVSRRALRAALSKEDNADDVLRRLVQQLTSEPGTGIRNIPFLGVVSGVCARLPKRRPTLEEMKTAILQFYSKEIVLSRTAAPTHILNGLQDFFTTYVSAEYLQKEIWPSLEKAILRSPEVIFAGVIPSLVDAIPKDIELSEIVSTRLTKPLLASFKSANPAIRQGAAKAFEVLISRCGDEKWLQKAVDEAVLPLKTSKIPNAEHRALQAQGLCSFQCFPNISQTILLGLTSAFSRESNEVALEAEVQAFCHHLAYLIRSQSSISKDIFTVAIKGCGEKRTAFRKIWIANIGDVLWNLDRDSLFTSSALKADFLKPVAEKLLVSFDEIAANPLPAVQGGMMSIAYALLALSCQNLRGEKLDDGNALVNTGNLIRQSLSLSPKQSFLLNPKIYSKLTSKEEFRWNTRSLSSLSAEPYFEAAEPAVRDAWGQAFLYMVASAFTPPDIRDYAVDKLSQSYLRNPELIGLTIIDSMWKWHLALENGDKDSAAVCAGTGRDRLFLVIRAIVPSPSEPSAKVIDSAIIRRQLIELLVLCRPELTPRSNWIDVTLKAGKDPGDIARTFPDECLVQVLLATEVSSIHVLVIRVITTNTALT